MKELLYPFDSSFILTNKRKLKRLLLSNGEQRIKKRIALLGGSTTGNIKQILELFLLNYGIEPVFYESEYNQYYQDALFPRDELVSFNPDFVYVFTTVRNIRCFPNLSDKPESIKQMMKKEMDRYYEIWQSIRDNFCCPVLQNNFELPVYRLLGNKDASDIHGAVNYISRLNQMMCEYIDSQDGVYIVDINYISADFGLGKWHDLFNWYMYKYAMHMEAIPYVCFNVANIIKSILGKNKKGFVLDLDNTLWGGVIGDDGNDGIKIGQEEATGQAYYDFQQFLKHHYNLGVLLSVDTKNCYENAIEGLNNPNCVLKPEDFVVIKSNWESKEKNFEEIADEIGVLPESLVFIDDNPAERYIVSEQFPNVSVPEINNVQDYIKTIDRSGFFETTLLSDDDKTRNQMYKDNVSREQLKKRFSDYKDYLLDLNMEAVISSFSADVYDRVSQLANKSNQYNLTTKRYTKEQIERISNDNDYITLYGCLKDRFGDNGLVSVVIGHIEKEVVSIELWVMSCRVLRRDLEYAMMDCFINECDNKRVNRIVGYYYPTSKNRLVKDFYRMMGFVCAQEDPDGNTVWELAISEYETKNKVIHVK